MSSAPGAGAGPLLIFGMVGLFIALALLDLVLRPLVRDRCPASFFHHRHGVLRCEIRRGHESAHLAHVPLGGSVRLAVEWPKDEEEKAA